MSAVNPRLERCPICSEWMLARIHTCPPRYECCPADEYLRQQQLSAQEQAIDWHAYYEREPYTAAEKYAAAYMRDDFADTTYMDVAVRKANDDRVWYLRVTREIAYSYSSRGLKPDEVEQP